MKTERIIEGNVKIFTDNIEDEAISQIKRLLLLDVFSDCKIRIMPDVHAGAGCVIGFTGNLGDKVIPNIVGVDIGCGMLVQPFHIKEEIDFHSFNEHINKWIPSGRDFRDENYQQLDYFTKPYYKKARELVLQLKCYRELKDVQRIHKSIGSLGGGNHFIELDVDDNGMHYLVIHTGSRNLGKQVADIYQKLAISCSMGYDELMKKQNEMIAEYKATGRRSELQEAIKKLRSEFKMHSTNIPQDLAYLEGDMRNDYIHDMKICQEWAKINRELIRILLMTYFTTHHCISPKNPFESVHNYLGDDNIIRKGSISAYEGEKCIIPLNMRDGSLICVGRGNEDWNYSAPHGAGRIMSRIKAFETLKLDDFQESMKGIYSESVVQETLDEAPAVYKPAEDIIRNIKDTVDIVNVIKPIFNFKATH